jgi:zinc protease
LGRGKSSRLYESLVKEKKIFNSINAHVMSSNDPGLLILEGKLNQGISRDQAESEMELIINQLKENEVSSDELKKVKNQAESSLVFSEVELLNRTMNLAFAANLGDPELIHKEAGLIQAVQQAINILRKENSSTLFYEAKKS